MVLSRGRPALRLLTWAFLLVIASTAVQGMVTQGLGDLPINAIGYGLCCAFFISSAATRIEVLGYQLRIINLVTITAIDARCLVTANGDNGLWITTTDGSIGFWGYGYSVAGRFTANGGAHHLAEKICRWRDEQMASAHHEHSAGEVRRRFRVEVLVIVLAAVAAVAFIGLVTH